MRASLFKTLPAVLLLALAGSACKDNTLGSETAGQRIKTAYGYNVVVIPPAKRTLRPAFSGQDLKGAEVGSASLRGSLAVVNFWASWCGECRNEQKTLENVWQKYKDRGVQFLGVNIRDRKADSLAYYDEFHVTYPSLYNFDSSVAAKFRLTNLPQTFVLDKQGRVAVKIIGATTNEAQLTKALDGELTAQAPTP